MADPLLPPSPSGRPRIVDIAFWLLVLGAVLLMLGGLLGLTVNFDTVRSMASESISDDQLRDYLTLSRGAGLFCVIAGATLAFVSGKTRSGDARYRRAAIGLALAAVVLVVLLAVFAGTNVVALLALVPIIVAAVLLTRPATAEWFQAHG